MPEMSAGVEISMVAAEGMTIGLAVLALVVIDKSVKNAPNNKLFPFISIIGFGLYAANLGKISYIMQFPSLFSISLSKNMVFKDIFAKFAPQKLCVGMKSG